MNLAEALITPLNTEDEISYQVEKYNSPFRYDSGSDYDLRGFYKKYGNLQPTATNGHLTDEYKLPWHETFSNQSIYYTGQPYAINPEGYTYLPDKLDISFWNNGLQPYKSKGLGINIWE